MKFGIFPIIFEFFLDHMFVGKDKSVKVTFIGQAVMQQVRPWVFLAPLQIGVDIEIHLPHGF